MYRTQLDRKKEVTIVVSIMMIFTVLGTENLADIDVDGGDDDDGNSIDIVDIDSAWYCLSIVDKVICIV